MISESARRRSEKISTIVSLMVEHHAMTRAEAYSTLDALLNSIQSEGYTIDEALQMAERKYSPQKKIPIKELAAAAAAGILLFKIL